MLENWLKPVSKVEEENHAWQVGNNITIFQEEFPMLNNFQVAIIGTGKEVNKIRSYLYKMSFPFSKFPIADIGNLRKPSNDFLLPVLSELLINNTIPIIVSHQSQPFSGQFKAYQNHYQNVNVAVIDETIPSKEDELSYLTAIRKSKTPKLNHFGLIGYQKHFIAPETLKMLEKKNYDALRLGFVKSNIEQAEPSLRDADTVFFNLSSLKQIEAPGCWESSPSGFTSEEACQLMRYAGMGDKLTSIGFYGYNPQKDRDDQTAKLIAQMIWYLLDGINNRKQDFPISTDRMIEYIVAFKQYNYEATFWKSIKSGRWWIQVANKSKEKVENHLIPCSYEDYKKACQDELSERVLRIFERFS